MLLSIVVPVYNSKNTLELLIKNIIMSLDKYKLEIILVDDGSCDGSFDEIKRLTDKYKCIKGIKLDKNYGQQNATFCGIQYSLGEYIVTIDDDLQHNVDDISKLLDLVKNGYDVCYGIYEYSGSHVRKIGSIMRDFLFNYLIGKPKNVEISSFRVINKKIGLKIKENKYKFIYISAQILTVTNNIANIKVKRKKRIYGKSGYTLVKLLNLYFKTFIYYSKYSFYPEFFKKGGAYRIYEKTF